MSFVTELQGLPPATTGLTENHIAALDRLLAAGDRGGFYLAYYEMLKQIDPQYMGGQSAKDASLFQVMMQAHISTYSGFLGGAALLGNALAKYGDPAHYTIPLDEFSLDIAQGLLDQINAGFPLNKGILTQNQIQQADKGVWISEGLGEYFPGNYQLWDDDYRNLLTAGTIDSSLAALQLIFGSRVGFSASDYSGSIQNYTGYDVKFDSNGKVVWVEEHIGVVDNLLPLASSATLDEPVLALLNPFVSQLGTNLLIGGALYNNAIGNFGLALTTELFKSLFTDSELDFQLRTDIVNFVGAAGQDVATDGHLPATLWSDFPLILRNSGSFADNEESHILFGHNTASISGGGGEDLGFAFANAQISGGLDDDLLLGTNLATLNGDEGEDTILVRDHATGSGGSGEDILIAADDATASGGAGGDSLIGLNHALIRGDEGDDWLVHFGSGEADGGAGNDTVVGIAPDVLSPADVLDLKGGSGDDWVMAFGGEGARLYGGAGSDVVVGWTGGEELLWGGDGSGADDDAVDYFSISDGSFVMDAGANDQVYWGLFPLYGGVQQSWQEGGWAYWSPFSSLVTSLGPASLVGGGLLTATLFMADILPMASFRYGQTTSGQLIVQVGYHTGWQAVIENYSLDIDTLQSTGNIVVYSVDWTKAGEGAIDAYRTLVKLALKSGFGAVAEGVDPLVIDLDRDGVELTRFDYSSARFDLDGDGFAEKAAWVKGDDGFLVRDLNGNGLIDDVSEMFGSESQPGFAALAALDGNADGAITSADASFASLKVWRDLDGDGITDTGELKTLAESGIASISLASHAPASASVAGNQVRAEATVTFANGQTSTVADVVLDVDQTDTQWLGDSTVSSAAAAANDNLPSYSSRKNVECIRFAA